MRAPWLPPLLLLLLALSLSTGRRTWIPLRVASRWAAVREVDPGREYWLRPECRLEDSMPKDCASEWVVSIKFWSPEVLTQVESALRRTARCRRSTLCTLYPFQTARFTLSDQQARWSSEKVHFVNGPLPSKQQFRLQLRSKASPGNCSFDAENLVIEMSDESRLLDGKKMFINGVEVRSAYKTLKRSEAQQEVGAAARRIGQIVLHRKAPDEPIATAEQLVRSLTDWAAWHGLSRSRGRRREGADVFRRFPQSALLPVQGVAKAIAIQRFSVIVESPDPPAKTNQRAANEKEKMETNELAEMQQRLSDLESYVSQMAFNSNSSSKTTSFSSRSPPFLYVSSSNISSSTSNKNGSTGNGNPFVNHNIRSIDDCKEAQVQRIQVLSQSSQKQKSWWGDNRGTKKKSKIVVRKLKKTKVFYLRPLKRFVRCTEDGELVVLQRQKNNIDFNRSWSDYRRGFGDAATGDFWLGLDFLASYTATGDACASIELTPWRMNITDPLIQYSDFEVASEYRNFRLWYSKSTSTIIKDALVENRGQPFSTYDRDRDAFVGNCASIFGGGNWFKSCTQANVFGKLDVKASRSSMCWRGVHPSQGDMCSPLNSITMSVRKASQIAKGRKVIFSSIAPNTFDCQCRLKEFLVNGTGLYHVTAGGAPGGESKNYNYFTGRGGRGAVVRTQSLMRAGTRLRIAVGCRGGAGRTCGHGGDATWITSLGSTWKLLLVAGGGGGGGVKSHGTHGRAVKSGHRANEVFSSGRVTEEKILGNAYRSRGRGWQDLKHRFLIDQRNITSEDLTSGAQSYFHHNRERRGGGGGGGGYEGGVSGSDQTAGGGGGGSFCDESPSVSCEVIEGGNFHNTGFVIIEKQTCF